MNDSPPSSPIKVMNTVNEMTIPDTNLPVKKKGWINRMRKIPCLGIFFALLYAFFMSTAVTFVKLIELHPIEVLMFRSIIQCIFFALIAVYHRRSPTGISGERLSLAGRAITGAINQGAWYISVRKISLTDSSAVYYSAPVFVALFAYFFLKEPFGLFEGLSVAITVTGVLLISKPSFIPVFGATEKETNFKSEHMEGLLYALSGALFFALSSIFLRKLQKSSTEIINFWFSSACTIISLFYVLYYGVFQMPSTFFEWLIIFLSGLFGCLGNIAFVIALKIEKAGPVSVAQTCNIVIVVIYQVTFFQEPISANTLIGAFLIASSVALTGLKDVFKGAQFVKNIKNYTTNTVTYQVDVKANPEKIIVDNSQPIKSPESDKYIQYNYKNVL